MSRQEKEEQGMDGGAVTGSRQRLSRAACNGCHGQHKTEEQGLIQWRTQSICFPGTSSMMFRRHIKEILAALIPESMASAKRVVDNDQEGWINKDVSIGMYQQ